MLWETRLWRTIFAQNNSTLFFKNKLNDSLIKNILNNNFHLFDEDFNTEIKTNILPLSSQLIEIKIKEDAFVDASRQLTETRIIGFYPIFLNSKDTITPGWIYFPSMRKVLAKIKVDIKEMPLVKNIDDIFYFRYFASDLKKSTNIFNKDISFYCKTAQECEKEKDRIEIQIIEALHEMLLYKSN